MEGIQHRLDCPARKHLNEAAAAVEVARTALAGGDVRVERRCKYCGRSAFIRLQGPEGNP
jgi:hypothetical protein